MAQRRPIQLNAVQVRRGLAHASHLRPDIRQEGGHPALSRRPDVGR